MTPSQVLHGISLANLTLYAAAAPSYDDKPADDWDESIDANNPANFNAADTTDTTDENETYV